jgi:hypothetical protein
MEDFCRCANPDSCRCPNSRWVSMLSNPQQYPSSTTEFPPSFGYPLPNYYGRSPAPTPQYYQFIAHPSSGTGSPMSSGPSTPSTQRFPGHNTIPFPPFADRTNMPIQPSPQVPEKRKRTSALSGNSRPKRVPARTSTTSNPSVSVSAAQSCGVGPSIPLPRTPRTREDPSPHSPDPPPITPIPPPTPSASTQRPDAEFTAKRRADSSNKATDVYFFMRSLTSDVPPCVLPAAGSGEGDLNTPGLLSEKPSPDKFSHLGCRFCP